MSVPTSVFVDTSAFKSSSFDFKGRGIEKFVQAIARAEGELLLPEVTEREVLRHLEQSIADAVGQLGASKLAPIRSWSKWPFSPRPGDYLEELQAHARSNWAEFLGAMSVCRIPTSKADIAEVMDWYAKGEPPFGQDRKKHEFPDAAVVSALNAVSRERGGLRIAVVSGDKDFEAACASHAPLVHYRSFATFTEALLGFLDRRADLYEIAQKAEEQLRRKVAEDFEGFWVTAVGEHEGDIEDIEVDEVELEEYHLIDIGDETTTGAAPLRHRGFGHLTTCRRGWGMGFGGLASA